jgi:hypothetical protein
MPPWIRDKLIDEYNIRDTALWIFHDAIFASMDNYNVELDKQVKFEIWTDEEGATVCINGCEVVSVYRDLHDTKNYISRLETVSVREIVKAICWNERQV